VSDRDQLAELASDLGLLVDARDWRALQSLFCETVDVDYTSLNGGEPQHVAPAELVGGWKAMLSPLQATQHLIANHVVSQDGDDARVATNVTATHVPSDDAGEHWVVGGRYDIRARRTSEGWRIAALTLTVRWQTGSQEIMGSG
jgi:hypothetical protein